MSFVKIMPLQNAAPPGSETEGTVPFATQEAEIERRVAHELARLREQTMIEAKADAQAQMQASLTAHSTQLAQTMSALNQALIQLNAPLGEKEQALAELVLDMAFQLARHIAGGETGHAREDLFTLVSGLLHEASAARTSSQIIRIYLHPSDIDTLETQDLACDAELKTDAGLTPGGAVIELVNQGPDPLDKTVWDAKLESRIKTVRNALALREEGA